MFNKNYLLPVLMLFVLVVGGCSTDDSNKDSQDSKQDNEITIGYDKTFVSLDPHNSDQNLDFSGFSAMYENLFEFDQDMELNPVLATDYEINEDGTVYTIDIREGVEFHDGTAFDAEAAKINIDRLADPDNALIGQSLVEMVKKTNVIDNNKLEIEIDEPYSAFINNLGHPSLKMISPDAIEEWGDELSNHPVGTGGFKYIEWEAGEHLKVEKNENYWDEGKPKVDKITFKSVPEDQSRVNMLKTGEVDFIFPMPKNLADDTDGEDGIEVESNSSIITWYLAMNMKKKPFDDQKVREAINYAIDKEAFVKVSQEGLGEIATSSIAPDVEYYSEQNVYEYNPEKAKQLLKEAGYEDGFETKIWGANDPERIKTMSFLQDQLSQVGIEVDVEGMEVGILQDKINSVENGENKEQEMYYQGWSPSNGTAEGTLQPTFSGDQIPPAGTNTSYFENDEVDTLIEEAMYAQDEEETKKKFKKIQEIIWDTAPVAFLSHDATVSAKKDYIKGIYYKPDGTISVKNAEIKKQ